MALGDYSKTTYVNGAAPGISAERLNRNEDKTAELDTVVAAHISDSIYKTAGGTATAITLIISETLVNGFPITFIASANNNGAATTINTKPLYKPNTTLAPALTAGKAYTVWYNSSSNCFFIKASEGGDLKPSNLVKNGNFANSTNCWTPANITNLAVSNNIVSFTATTRYGLLQQNIPVIQEHEYYICGYVQTSGGANSVTLDFQRTTAPSPVLCVAFNTLSNTMEFMSVIGTATETSNDYTLRVMDMRSSDWTKVSAKELMCIDLTQSFEAGSKPTQSEMDAIVKTKGWWDSNLYILTYDATITENTILQGYSGYAQGVKRIGTIPNYEKNPSSDDFIFALSAKGTADGYICVDVPTGYYKEGLRTNGFGRIIANDSNFIPANIPVGKTMFGLAGTNNNKKWKYGHASSLSVTTFTANNLGFTPNCIVIKCFTTVNSNAYEITAVYNSGIYQPIATYARIRTESYAPEGNYGSYVAKIPIWSVSAGTFSFSVSGYTFSEVDYWAYE